MTPEEQRVKYRPKFEAFLRRSDAEEVAGLLRHYLDNTIKDPRPQEFSYWSVSCLPSTAAAAGPRLFCVNIDRMETFVVGHLKEDPKLWSFINVSASAFASIRSFRKKFPNADVSSAGYAAAKDDCLQICMNGIEEIAAIINNPAVIRAAQELNGRLKRTIYARFHNFDLLDYAYTP